VHTPSKATVIAYREVFERPWIIEPVPGWAPSQIRLTRLTQRPKCRVVDSALVARILGTENDALLSGIAFSTTVPRDGTLLGQLFESLVTLPVCVYADQPRGFMRHLQTDDGVGHLMRLREKPGDELSDSVSVAMALYAHPRTDGTAVAPAAFHGPRAATREHRGEPRLLQPHRPLPPGRQGGEDVGRASGHPAGRAPSGAVPRPPAAARSIASPDPHQPEGERPRGATHILPAPTAPPRSCRRSAGTWPRSSPPRPRQAPRS
jgi:hypothetical protein